MDKFLIEYCVQFDESFELKYHRVKYSSREKLINDLNLTISDAITKNNNSFNFLTHKMFLEDFEYYSPIDEKRNRETPIVFSLDEWFNNSHVAEEITIESMLLEYAASCYSEFPDQNDIINEIMTAKDEIQINKINKILAKLGKV